MKILPYGRQSIDQADIDAVSAQLRDDWLTQGKTVAAFENRLCEITGARFAVAVSSGTAALHLACLAAGVGTGDVGLVPDITFVATANAVRYAGGTPSLIDVDESTGLVSLNALERACKTSKPKVVLPVSFSGSVPDLAKIQKMAREVGATIIEDAAHSVGATYETGGHTYRSASCAHSEMAILSFHPVKHMTTGEGGAITTNDESFFTRLCDLRTHGITKDAGRLETNDGPWYYEQHSLGFNYRITDFQCALGVSQSRKLEGFLARRREIAAVYDRAFQNDARITTLAVPNGVQSAYHLYVLRLVPTADETVHALSARRKEFFLHLREKGIAPQVHYIPLHRQPDLRRAGYAEGSFSGAENYYAGCVSIPMYPALTAADVDRVVDTVKRTLDELE